MVGFHLSLMGGSLEFCMIGYVVKSETSIALYGYY